MIWTLLEWLGIMRLHRFEDVVVELEQGLRDGSITLD